MYSSFRAARFATSGGNLLALPLMYSSWVRWSANDLIMQWIVTCHVTHVKCFTSKRAETKVERSRLRVDRSGDRTVRKAQIADGQFNGCAGAGCCSGREMRAGESLLCRLVQQDGVALQLRQQLLLGQTTDGHDSDDCRAMGIDVFRFKRHTACSFGDAPTAQNVRTPPDGSCLWFAVTMRQYADPCPSLY